MAKNNIVLTSKWVDGEVGSNLSDQTGKHEDAREKVGHLKGDLKDGVGLVEATDVDQTADSVVITTQVPA